MPKKSKETAQVAVALVGEKGQVEFVPSSDVRYGGLATAIASQYGLPHRVPLGVEDNPYIGDRQTPYQRILGGSQNLKQLLLPKDTDFDAIYNRVDFYRRHHPWINRALVLRAQFNASELNVHAPRNEDQTRWMQELARELKFFSFAREWFWQLRAFNQVVTLWKTTRDGNKPVSIECADLRAHQPRGPGLTPRIVVIPAKVESLRRLADESKFSGKRGEEAKRRLAEFPPPLVDALLTTRGTPVEVDSRLLEPYGYHLDYTALDRRHHEDWAFPGMYSIFADIEMVEMARGVDLNALHHYKAAFILVRLGPEDPGGNDAPIMATEPQLKKLEKKLMEQARNKMPTLVARGDLRIDFITPPIEVFTTEKYKMAVANIFDWLGIPKAAWPGQDLQGAFAAAQVTLKFLQQESKDERDLFRETYERFFYERAKSSNAFKSAEWPIISFDPNSLTEQRLILDTAKLLWTIGASEDTVLDVLGFNGEVEATQMRDFDATLKQLKVKFEPRPERPLPGQSQGRPQTVNQATPERETKPQPRPSTS